MGPLWVHTTRVEPDITVIELAGRFIMGENRRVEEIVLELFDKGQTKIVFDLSRIDYIDSSGMGSIAYCLAKAARLENKLRIAGLPNRLMPLFRMTRLESIISFFPDVAAASTTPW